MIRTYNKQTVTVENGATKYLADIFCNSTDTKPTANLVNGSKLTEVDTGKTYLFDEVNEEWTEYNGTGGGGSTGGLKTFIVSSIPDLGDPPAIISTGAFAEYYGERLLVFNDPPANLSGIYRGSPQGYAFSSADMLRSALQNPNVYFTILNQSGGDTEVSYEGRIIIVSPETLMDGINYQRMVGEGTNGECIMIEAHEPRN